MIFSSVLWIFAIPAWAGWSLQRCAGQMFSPGHHLPLYVRCWLPPVRLQWLTGCRLCLVLVATPSMHLSKPILNPSVHYSMKASECKHVLCGIKSLVSFETHCWGVLLIFFLFSLPIPLQETIGKHLPCISHRENWFANVFLSLLLFFSEKEMGRVWSLVVQNPFHTLFYLGFFATLLVHFNPSQKMLNINTQSPEGLTQI